MCVCVTSSSQKLHARDSGLVVAAIYVETTYLSNSPHNHLIDKGEQQQFESLFPGRVCIFFFLYYPISLLFGFGGNVAGRGAVEPGREGREGP